MADVEKVIKGLNCCTECKGESCRKCPYSEDMPTDKPMCMPELACDALSVIRELKAENERLRQEKADAVKRIDRCRQNCISNEKDCDIAYNKSGKEWYRAKADAYKQALDIINRQPKEGDNE